MKDSWYRVCAVPLVVGTLAMLPACSAESTVELPVTLPEKNLETWSMPLDIFSKSETQTHAEGYAERLQSHVCMTKAGYEYPVSWEPSPPRSRTFTDYGTKIFSVSIAKEFGYHAEPTDDTLSNILRSGTLEANKLATPQWDAQLTKCLKQDRASDLGLEQDPQHYNGLWIDVSQTVRQTDEMRELARKWRACMEKAGVPDLPSTPDDMPTESLRKAFTSAPAVVDSGASQHELDVATADAKCQVSTGYVQTLYDRMWDGQVKVLRANLDKLDANRRLIERNAEKAAKIIDLYAPPAPAASP